MNVAENLAAIEQQISQSCKAVDRNPQDVKVIAVTKYVSIATAEEAYHAGVTHLGENREEGLNEKWSYFGEKFTWHFIGSLQTKKVKKIIDKVDYIHSLDRLSLAEEIQKRASQKIKCFVQLNVSGEESKHGIHPDELQSFIQNLEAYPLIEIVGLMTMAPFTEDRDLIRACFHKLKVLQQEVQALQLAYAPCQELSMGMSNDYDIAVEEGATFIRIGTSLVGNK
ncbi:YggS family pyridoxal phosphate-dependent enzyme [Bacillus sp. PS06]|uniref:YggS family pyridoxal phosphate-dependent enzyme n=1 Tax=Bacillus sp. PS06 TaxID=2764176 RepID=UPI00177B07D9|nr:YggS family pyridoxal phosphate-dependent enzyme [Bacillus sp. PS06]MBD8068376.1 YggS family pyridoxal phosphate-dependent enzyme [Bacillus sp. PS06]